MPLTVLLDSPAKGRHASGMVAIGGSSSPGALARRWFSSTAASYDRFVHVGTVGLDRLWKEAMFARVPRSAKRVLDLGCGTGIVTLGLAQFLADAEFTGVDLSEGYLDIYRRRVLKEAGLRGEAVLGGAEEVDLEGSYDVVISSYVPKYVEAGRLLSNLAPHVRSGTVVVLHEFTLPPEPFPRALWSAYHRAAPFLFRRAFPEWGEVLDGSLAALIRESDWFERFPEALASAGYGSIERIHLTLGFAGLIRAIKT